MTLPADTEVRLRCLEAAVRSHAEHGGVAVLKAADKYVDWVERTDCKTDADYARNYAREADIAPEISETSSPAPHFPGSGEQGRDSVAAGKRDVLPSPADQPEGADRVGRPAERKHTTDYVQWAEQEDELRRLYIVDRLPLREIARRLGRTEAAVSNRASILGLKRGYPGRLPAGSTECTGRERLVLDGLCALYRRDEPVNNAVIAMETGIGLNAISYYLQSLEKKGYIKRHGNGRGRWHEIVKTSDGTDPPTTPLHKPPPETSRGPASKPGQPLRRFTEHAELDPESVQGLDESHDAVVTGRTLFPSTVVQPADSPQLLVSGHNSRKLGDRVVKGPWKGMPIFQLTLEERATCPRSCPVYRTCYGNGMPRARRHKHGPELEKRLEQELSALQEQHPQGFVVRLHVLGDFYSADYVKRWRFWLGHFPGLRVFGYTAWPRVSEIGKEIERVTSKYWERFAVRFSSDTAVPQGVVTIWRKPESGVVAEGIVCPAQTGATACCGTCGLCWSPAAREKTIVFVGHGPKWEGRPPKETTEETVARNAPAKAPFPAEKKRDYRLPSERGEDREVFTEGKQRRCAGCRTIFRAYHTQDLKCTACSPNLCSACKRKPPVKDGDLCAGCRRIVQKIKPSYAVRPGFADRQSGTVADDVAGG